MGEGIESKQKDEAHKFFDFRQNPRWAHAANIRRTLPGERQLALRGPAGELLHLGSPVVPGHGVLRPGPRPPAGVSQVEGLRGSVLGPFWSSEFCSFLLPFFWSSYA